MASYLQSAGNHQWRYDFHLVSVSATVIVLYTCLVPMALWALLKWSIRTDEIDLEEVKHHFKFKGSDTAFLTILFQQAPYSPTILSLVCVYGYSMAIYIPVSVLWTIQVSFRLMFAYPMYKILLFYTDSSLPMASGGNRNVLVRICSRLYSNASPEDVEIFIFNYAHHWISPLCAGIRIYAGLFPPIGFTRGTGFEVGGTGEDNGGDNRCPQKCNTIEGNSALYLIYVPKSL